MSKDGLSVAELTEPRVAQTGPPKRGEFTYVDISSIDRETKRIVDPKVLPASKAPSRAKQLLQAGDVLVSMTRPNLNAVAIVPPDLDGAIGSTGFHVLRAKEANPGFLYYAVQTSGFVDAMCRKVQGALYPAVRPRDIASFCLPQFSLDQQQCIVAEIEKQFTRLEAGLAGLRRVQANLKRYRAAVLKAACDGRLLPGQKVPQKTALKELIGSIGQGWSPKCDLNRQQLPDEWGVITTTAVQPMKYVDHQGKPLPSELKPRGHLEIKEGDFLMTRKGPRKRAGVTCLVRSTRSKLMVCDTVYRFRCHEHLVSPSYLEMALNSPDIVSAIDRKKAGISESGVSLTHDKIGAIEIPLPDMGEQIHVVAEVERRLSIIDELEAVATTNIQRATRLRQSILQRAFTGELVS